MKTVLVTILVISLVVAVITLVRSFTLKPTGKPLSGGNLFLPKDHPQSIEFFHNKKEKHLRITAVSAAIMLISFIAITYIS